jgi:enoyl-CoA hydratase/carnithine racemase
VQGGCFGGGTGIVAACDVVIAADNAMFSIAETRWGLTAAIILPQPPGQGPVPVRRYALTVTVDAHEAHNRSRPRVCPAGASTRSAPSCRRI